MASFPRVVRRREAPRLRCMRLALPDTQASRKLLLPAANKPRRHEGHGDFHDSVCSAPPWFVLTFRVAATAATRTAPPASMAPVDTVNSTASANTGVRGM